MTRRFFWNIKQSFMGIKFVKEAPFKAVILPLTVVIPGYLFLQLQKGIFFKSLDFSFPC